MFCAKFGGTFKICLHTKFQMPGLNGSLLTAIILGAQISPNRHTVIL